MRIRSITLFVHPRWPISELVLRRAGIFSRSIVSAFKSSGYQVQTVRLATPSFTTFLPEEDYANAIIRIEILTHGEGFDYVSMGPAIPENIETYQAIPHMLASSGNLFFSGHLTTPKNEISLRAVHACAEVIHDSADLEKNGFANLRFAALANVPPFAPFFPAAYSEGKSPGFALAMEAADLAVSAFSEAETLVEARESLINAIESHAKKLEEIAEKTAKAYGFEFKGIDFTLAPFPVKELSLGFALEKLGLPAVGYYGSLAAAAFLTDTLDQANFKRTGFNGLMLPLLEDATLAQRAAEGILEVKDLLMYSAVCGTGLDTIPLPGDTSVEALQAVLLDIAALSLRLKKPLTARLMPIPGLKAGDDTGFEFEYFANSKVLALPSKPFNGVLAGNENIFINPRIID